jgi:xyloglucan-specific exo-beta-1,4-glucanase
MGGAYRWEDAAGSWVPLQDAMADGNMSGVESIAPDPVDPDTVYMAAGTYRRDPAAMLRSGDRGRTWNVVPVPFRMGRNEDGRGLGERLAVDPHKTGTLLFGSRHDGLQRSLDRGATWEKLGTFPWPGLGLPTEPRGMTNAGIAFPRQHGRWRTVRARCRSRAARRPVRRQTAQSRDAVPSDRGARQGPAVNG